MIPSQRSSAPPLPALPAAFLPGPDFVDRAWGASERSPAWLRSFQALFDAGRLAGTGHLCLLAGQGEPEAVAALAEEGGCSGLLAGERALGAVARRYAHRMPLVAEVLPERDPLAQARRLRDTGCVGVCVLLDGRDVGDRHLAALCAAATAEGLVVVPRYRAGFAHGGRREIVGPRGLALGAGLAWCENPREVAPLRERVLELWQGRVGLLAGGSLDDLALAAQARRAGAMGLVVAATPDADPSAQVAALHALQDVWADGSIPLD